MKIPNALDSKVALNFDHVKQGLKVYEGVGEEEQNQRAAALAAILAARSQIKENANKIQISAVATKTALSDKTTAWILMHMKGYAQLLTTHGDVNIELH
ncbi:hypothetical protein K2173_014918 [Erythroxylum novogranatense]|uniref:Uncharacterized protein n=1 Tax=Erythroxylum novogranatense TaxID=1862640 RepID=A0AAV8THC6_9ROSI|nr:hypothetical protein K2173_014918 [Erythroxylum novogranatense]